MSLIDRHSPIPLYEQVKQVIRERILNGDYAPGTVIPTEKEMCDEFNVSRITIKQAMNELARGGLIQRIQGKGSIVRDKIAGELDVPLGFSELTRRRGFTPGSRIITIEHIEGNFELRRFFHAISPQQRFWSFRRLLTINDAPVAVITSVVSEEMGNEMQKHELNNASFYGLYREISGMSVGQSEATLTAINASTEIAQLLNVALGSAHIHYRAMTHLQGVVPVEYTTGIYHGDYFQWRVQIYQLREERVQADFGR